MSIILTNLTTWAAIAERFVRVDRQTKKPRPDYPQEICGPSVTLGGLGLFLIFVLLIPA